MLPLSNFPSTDAHPAAWLYIPNFPDCVFEVRLNLSPSPNPTAVVSTAIAIVPLNEIRLPVV